MGAQLEISLLNPASRAGVSSARVSARELRDSRLGADRHPAAAVPRHASGAGVRGDDHGPDVPRGRVTSASGPGDFPVVGIRQRRHPIRRPAADGWDRLLEVEGHLPAASLYEFWALAVPSVRRPAGRPRRGRPRRELSRHTLGEPDPYWWSGIPTSVWPARSSRSSSCCAAPLPGRPARRFFVATLALCVLADDRGTMLTDLGPPGHVVQPVPVPRHLPDRIAMQVSV